MKVNKIKFYGTMAEMGFLSVSLYSVPISSPAAGFPVISQSFDSLPPVTSQAASNEALVASQAASNEAIVAFQVAGNRALVTAETANLTHGSWSGKW